MLTVGIGWDRHEVVAWHVLAHSIIQRSSTPVNIVPIKLELLKDVFNRPRSIEQSTDFTYSRFLTPSLSDGGISIFLDADMLCLCDINELADYAKTHAHYDVHVVKHNYEPKKGLKFREQKQTVYPCKNWSSLMVFNGFRSGVRALSPSYVNHASAMDLHQFKWANGVGDLPVEYNHLVGEYKPNPKAKIIHFTRGGPWFKGFEHCEYSKEWFDEFQRMCHCETYDHFSQNKV